MTLSSRSKSSPSSSTSSTLMSRSGSRVCASLWSSSSRLDTPIVDLQDLPGCAVGAGAPGAVLGPGIQAMSSAPPAAPPRAVDDVSHHPPDHRPLALHLAGSCRDHRPQPRQRGESQDRVMPVSCFGCAHGLKIRQPWTLHLTPAPVAHTDVYLLVAVSITRHWVQPPGSC